MDHTEFFLLVAHIAATTILLSAALACLSLAVTVVFMTPEDRADAEAWWEQRRRNRVLLSALRGEEK